MRLTAIIIGEFAMASWDKYTPQMLSILRIVVALIFIEHGTQKLLAFPGLPASGHQPAIMSLSWIAAVFEAILGPLLLVGLWSRWIGFVLAGEMAVAYWLAHFPRSFWPVLNGGDAAILYCFVFLFIACAGGGAWSLDQVLWRRKRTGSSQPQPARVPNSVPGQPSAKYS